jgi:diadenosine tetraphosphate (Ap4A) HIT family hydrolase
LCYNNDQSSPAHDKMNIASLGNLVPHVHWHVIPRFADDSHFPQAVWSEPSRVAEPRPVPPDFLARLATRLERQLRPQSH